MRDYRQTNLSDLFASFAGTKTNPLSQLQDYQLTEIINFGNPLLAGAAKTELSRRGPRGLLGSEAVLPETPQIVPTAEELQSMQQQTGGLLNISEAPMARPDYSAQQADGLLSDKPSGLSGLLTGEGSSARLLALGKALMQGPSRTPISFGQSLMQGLAAGEEAVDAEETRKLKRKQTEIKSKQLDAMDIISDPNATSEEKDAAFKAAYPAEAYKLEYKKGTQDLFDVVLNSAIRKKAANLPLTEVEQDAYDKKMSAGGSALDQFLGSLLLGDSKISVGSDNEALRQAAMAERNKRNQAGE